MQITAPVLLALQQGFNAAFLQGLGSVKPTLDLVAMRVPSTADTENYGWMKELPGMREWVGQRQINNLEASAAQLKNKTYEHTIGVKRENIEDDKLGIYTPMLSMQGEVVARHPDELVWGLLPVGFSTTGFDGQYFFDTDHVGYQLYVDGVPVGSPATVALQIGSGGTGALKRWNGTAWVPATVKRWDGAAWVNATVKRWDGAAWVTV